MGHAFHQLFYHFAWATNARINLISRDYRPELLKIINEETWWDRFPRRKRLG
jgi:hypothetical protein